MINLKRRPDRLQAVKDSIPDEWVREACFTTDWPGPVDGNTITGPADLEKAGITLYPDWKLEGSANSFWNRPLKLGEIGCSFSHLSVWRRAKALFEADPAIDHVVVLEDDVYVKDKRAAPGRLRDIVQSAHRVDPGWGLIYLGRVLQHGQVDRPLKGTGLVKPGFSYCTYGYILSRLGLDQVLDAHLEENLIPSDEFLAACYTMHPRRDISRLFPPVLHAYAASPDLVYQRTKRDGGSDTETSKLWTK